MPGDTSPDATAPSRPPAAVPVAGRVDARQLTPRQIVEALDRHVVGQAAAKRAVAVAVRNRLRRLAVGGELGADIVPKNILMIGPTGVGKTEIARRLAKLTASPFVKVEASKYTEVGYVGRDVESMVRDLAAESVAMIRAERESEVRDKAAARAEDRLIDLLVPPGGSSIDAETMQRRRDAVRTQLRAGHLDERRVDVEVTEKPPGIPIFGPGQEPVDLSSMLPPGFMPRNRKRRSVSVAEAKRLLLEEEASSLVDDEEISRAAVERAQSQGIVFIDEMDKIAGREGRSGPDVSREGVQRDLLPIVEGTSVQTKWGAVRTEHVLFIAAGAFHVSKPSDLIPELQGRFPVRVQLASLTLEDFVRILSEPDSSLVRQHEALLATEGVSLRFTKDGIAAIAEIAARVNDSHEDIGARRLHAILETVLDEVSFAGSEMQGQEIVVDDALVRRKLDPILKDQDYTRYVL
jgi:ATP-dependent HslUV protease ATP-binding subunit HslU